MGIHVTISCRYCIAFEVMILFLVRDILFSYVFCFSWFSVCASCFGLVVNTYQVIGCKDSSDTFYVSRDYLHKGQLKSVFVYFYRQDAAKRQTAGIVFTHRPKIRFSIVRVNSLHRFGSNFAGPTGTWVRLAAQNFTSIGAGGCECGPKNIKNLVKSRPVGATPLTDF